MYFTRENVERYLEAARARGIEELGCSEHVYRFRQALEIWDHPYWVNNARDDLDEYCEFVRTTPLKLGLETDYITGREEQIAGLLEGRDLDYVLGSVHFVGEYSIDEDVFSVWDDLSDADRVWSWYFETLAAAARSGLYDILAHPDVVKCWGHERPRPTGDLRRFYEPAIEAIVESGIAVEISTAGFENPDPEIYPAPEFARLCLDAGADFTLSSDAHAPEEIGFEYDRARAFMEELGIEQICTFTGRRRTLVPVG
jgi:histidinol-phosphatase (PHP family)